ncbi:MAG: hypothetical protein HRT52_16275 [Colwellia sp.]|nr:hypothetical protein [Colwellia sp.]
MVLSDVENNILVHELQLGEQLNECVHNKRRSDFSLMLAMLADDVRSHSQFLVPKTEQAEIVTTDDTLRKEFNLPPVEPLALTQLEKISDFNQANLIVEQRLADLHLSNAITPIPLAFRDDVLHITHDVIANTSLYCQQQYKQDKSSPKEQQRLAFNAKAWLNTIQETIVKSPLFATA